jgi:hypothetical protein
MTDGLAGLKAAHDEKPLLFDCVVRSAERVGKCVGGGRCGPQLGRGGDGVFKHQPLRLQQGRAGGAGKMPPRRIPGRGSALPHTASAADADGFRSAAAGPRRIQGRPRKGRRGLAWRVHEKRFVLCHSATQSFQTWLAYRFPLAMGSMMDKMTKRAADRRLSLSTRARIHRGIRRTGPRRWPAASAP